MTIFKTFAQAQLKTAIYMMDQSNMCPCVCMRNEHIHVSLHCTLSSEMKEFFL